MIKITVNTRLFLGLGTVWTKVIQKHLDYSQVMLFCSHGETLSWLLRKVFSCDVGFVIEGNCVPGHRHDCQQGISRYTGKRLVTAIIYAVFQIQHFVAPHYGTRI